MPDLTFSSASEALDGLDCELGIGTGSTGTGGKADGIAADACAAGSAIDENGGDGAGGAGGAGGPSARKEWKLESIQYQNLRGGNKSQQEPGIA